MALPFFEESKKGRVDVEQNPEFKKLYQEEGYQPNLSSDLFKFKTIHVKGISVRAKFLNLDEIYFK